MSSNDKFYIEEITGIHSDFYGVDYDNPNPPETEPTPEEQREADLYWESQSKRQVIRSKQGIFSSITNSLFKL